MSRWLPSAAITEHLIVLLVSGVWLALSIEYPYGDVTEPGPGFLPTILGVLGLALGLGGLFSALRDREASVGHDQRPGAEVPSLTRGGTSAAGGTGTDDGATTGGSRGTTESHAPVGYTPDTPGRSRRWALSVTVVSTIAFLAVLPLVGYGPAMFGLMLAYLMVGTVRLRFAVLGAVVGSLGSWLLFELLLELPLPGSLLDGLFGL